MRCGLCRAVDAAQSFPYDVTALSWSVGAYQNSEDVYCYCGRGRYPREAMLQCSKCNNFFHGSECPYGGWFH